MLSSPAQERPRSNTLTIIQIVVSSIGLLVALLAALAFLLFGLVTLTTGKPDSSPASMFSLAWVGGLIAVLTLPSFLLSLQRLRSFSFPLPRIHGFKTASIMLLAWPLVLVLGNWAATQSHISWLVLPPLLLMAVGLPVWWIVEFARRKLPGGSLQRGWGIVNFSLFITNPLVIIAELVFFFFLLIGFVVWIMSQPALLQEIQALAQELQTFNGDLNVILPLLTPFVQKPIILIGVFTTLAFLVPAIEEMLKPLALLPLLNHRLSPAEGFVAGALCGASFALLESLISLAGQEQEGWAILAIGRAGTGLLHITTTALTGWALVRARQNGRYGQLGLVYLGAVLLHGLWNGLSVLMALNTLMDAVPGNVLLAGLSRAAPFVLMLLVLFLFLLLWGMSWRLRQPPKAGQAAIIDSPQSY